VTDENGVVTEKFFHRHYATRESAGAIRDSALGEILARHEVPAIELGTDQVQISAFLSDPSLKFETQSTVYVRFELEDGLHMYGRPLPDGYIASEASIPDTPGLRVGAARYPTTHTRAFPELEVTLNVYEGVVDVAIPVTPNAELFGPSNRDQPDALVVPVSVLFQVCSETICYTPRTETLSLTLPVGPLLRPGAPLNESMLLKRNTALVMGALLAVVWLGLIVQVCRELTVRRAGVSAAGRARSFVMGLASR